MGESQTYEFVALDRPLTADETTRLRGLSASAEITAARFFARYDWGELEGDAGKLLEQSFDAFFHFANWGVRRIAFRLPTARVDVPALAAYFPGTPDVTLKVLPDHVVVDLCFDSEDAAIRGDEPAPALASLLPLRDELLRGDTRFAYLAWLWAVGRGDLDDDATEPPVPPGLAEPTPVQAAFVDAFKLDAALLAAAAQASRQVGGDDEAFARWVTKLPAKAKDGWLARAVAEPDVALGAELRRAFREATAVGTPSPPRTVGALRALAAAGAGRGATQV